MSCCLSIREIMGAVAVMFVAVISGCSDDAVTGMGEDAGGLAASQEAHEHSGETHEHSGETHEHSGETHEHSGETHEHSGETHEHESGEHAHEGGELAGEERGEHDRDGEGGHAEEGEESGTELTLEESYDRVRNGARLVLDYDSQSNSFKGTVENTTAETLERVRVEVHLSNGKELGPTTPEDLPAGEKRDVELPATSTDFDGWTAHPEVGNEEHGHGGEHGEGGEDGEHGGEHGGEGRGEHDRDGEEPGDEGNG